MNRELTRSLILYIVDQLQDMEAPISTIRLVKLLYWIDLEYYKRHYKTLTGIDWVKYKYGPYFFALPEILRSARIDLEPEEILTEHGKGFTFRSLEQQDISGVVDYSTEGLIKRVIEKWANEDKDVLLENVYETMPVKYGHFNQPLDFTYETDHLILKEARDTAEDFVTLDDLFKEFGNPFDEAAE